MLNRTMTDTIGVGYERAQQNSSPTTSASDARRCNVRSGKGGWKAIPEIYFVHSVEYKRAISLVGRSGWHL